MRAIPPEFVRFSIEEGALSVDYAAHYERCCKEPTTPLQRLFMRVLTREAEKIGQRSHKIWSLKYVLDHYLTEGSDLRILDCGVWDGWFLSFDSPRVAQKIGLDFDPHFARELAGNGIDFVLADMERGAFPLASESLELVAMTSTLEHLSCPEHIASEIYRVLRPGGVVFITVPDIMKYKFRFWNDITHKRPFTRGSLRFLFESHRFETLALSSYNHNLFVAGHLFPRWIHQRMMRFRGDALLYIGRKPGA
jgi:SAM-dependent methyltransferase